MFDFRVVLPHLQNQTLTIRDRTVRVDENGATAPLTEDEHRALVAIKEFRCASEFTGERCPVCSPPEEDLVGETLLAEVLDAFEGQVVTPPIGPDPDIEDATLRALMGEMLEEEAEADGFKDLFDAWLDMDEKERLSTLDDLEDAHVDDSFLVELFNHEAQHLNSPAVIRALDTAIARIRKPRSAEQINTQIVRQSAAGKVQTKNPPTKKRGK